MSEPILLFMALILTATIAIVATVVLFLVVLGTFEEAWPRRLAMAVLLPWGGLEAWRRGRRFLPALWASSIALYLALRIVVVLAAPLG